MIEQIGGSYHLNGNSPTSLKEADVNRSNGHQDLPKNLQDFEKQLQRTSPLDTLLDILSAGSDVANATYEFQRLIRHPISRGESVPSGDGSTVIIVPGFGAMEWHYYQTRNIFQKIGYQSKTYPLRFWFNIEPMEHMKEQFMEYIYKEKEKSGKKVKIIGHSKGGLMTGIALASYPKEFEESVDHAVFIGSPIPHRVNSAVGWGYWGSQKLLNGDDFQFTDLIDDIENLTRNNTTLQTTLILSKNDPIIEGRSYVRDESFFIVDSSHSGMHINPEVLSLIAHRMAGSNVVQAAA